MKFKRVISLVITGALLLSISASTIATANATDYNATSSTNSISDEVNRHLPVNNIASAQQQGFEHFKLSNETIATANATDYNNTSGTNIISNRVNKHSAVESSASAQEKDFKYSKLSNGTIEINSYIGKESDVTIPSSIDGYTVTAICDNAFKNCNSLYQVTIPKTVTAIGKSAFAGCKKLSTVNLSNGLLTIDDFAFYNCTALTTIYVPDSVTYIGDEALGVYTASDGEDYAMEGFTITSYKGSCAYAYALFAVQAGIFYFNDLGKSQYYVDYYYYLNEDNTISIYYYLGDKSTVVIPSTIDGYTVARIESGTFFDNDTITNVTVKSTVHCIGHASFSGCDNLKDVSLTEGLEEIGDDYDPLEYDTFGAFEHCPSLKNIKIPSSVKNMTYSGLGYYVDGSKIPGFTITGYKGTAGQSYATKNGFKFVALDYVTPDYIELNKNSLTLGVGESYTLKSTITPSNAKTEYSWSSGNKSVATVSSTGNITAKGAGTTTITVKTSNGKTASCTINVKYAPNEISLNKTSLTLGVGETFDLNSSLPSGTASYSVKYSSSNTSVAPVNASGGLLTAKKAGTAIITATTYNGKTATCTVTVKNPPSKISLNKTSLTLGVGETFDLNSSLPSGTASYSVKYSSSNTDIVAVNESGGLVTAKKLGTATITATTYNGKTATCTITVKNAPDKISINKTTVTLGVGETFGIITSMPSDTACYGIKYSSSNTAVATVDEASGIITAKSTGRAVITVLTHNSRAATCTVTVKNAPDKISFNQTSLTLGMGETFNLISSLPSNTASYSIKYSNSNSSAVAFNEADGLITAKNVGTAVITATTYNGKTATCAVTVKKAPVRLSLNRASITLGVGELFDLNTALPAGEAAYNVEFSSSNPAVATVTSVGGVITSKGVGTAVITATAYNGKQASCTVTVKNAPSEISIAPTEITIGVGEVFYLSNSLPADTASFNIKYASRNTSIATVTSLGGVITGKGAGTVTINAISHNGKTSKCTVTVKNAPDKITLNETALTLKVGETFDLESTLPEDTASYSIKYTSRNSNVVAVDSFSGLVTAKAVGTATITALTHNNKKATCKVTVVE